MARGGLHYSLEDQALSLVKKLRDTPGVANEKALIDWSRQSPDHARAVARAERLLTIARSLPADLSHPSDRWVIPLQTWWLRLRESALPLSCVFTAGLVVAVLIYTQLPRHAPTEAAATTAALPPPAEYRTARGQVREIVLDDGSTLWLDWRSRAAVYMDDNERYVSLYRGGGAFDVVPDDSRPFVVKAADVTTRVTGTEFVVRHVGSAGVEVAVLEGSVNVNAASTDGAIDLTAGQAVLGEDGSLGAIARRSIEELGAWREGLIVFTDRPLLEALRALEPYTSYRLETDQLYDESRRVTGTFLVERADASLRTLLVNHDLDAELIAPNTLVLRHSPPARPR